jgi:hypothetical protein
MLTRPRRSGLRLEQMKKLHALNRIPAYLAADLYAIRNTNTFYTAHPCFRPSHRCELARIDRNVEERTMLRLDLAPAVGPA